MKYTQLRSVAAISVCVLIVLLGISYMSEQGIWEAEGATADIVETGSVLEPENVSETVGDDKQPEQKEISSDTTETGVVAHIMIPKLSDELTVTLEDIYVNRQIKVTIANAPAGMYSEEMLVCDNKAVRDVSVENQGKTGTVFIVGLDGVYVYELSENDNSYIITLKDVHSVYDKVIVVDAGHGGKDNGCGSPYSGHYEKKITLAVAEKLKDILDNTDIKVYYTRLKDETVYLRPRVTLANDVKADMFISIHCNFYEYYYAYQVKGAETLYSSSRTKVNKKSKKLSAIMLDNLVAETGISKRSVVDRKKDIYILKKSRVPATIVEMAYMSDRDNLKYITDKRKQKDIAKGLYKGIVEAYSTMYNKEVETLEMGDYNK